VEVRPGSEITVGSEQIVLHNGVVATGKAPVRLGEYQIEVKDPSSPQNLIVVADRGGQQLVAAHRGDAVITAAGLAPLLVPSGSFAIPAAAGGKSPQDETNKAKEDEEKKKKRRGGAAPAGSGGKAASGGWTIGSLSHGSSVALVAGVGAAAVGGTVAAVALTGDSSSPSN
jgi:hypothetical protein